MISQIVLLRHATRSAVLNFSGGESSLNTVGLAQADDFAHLVQQKSTLPSPTLLVASPKLRARQTLEPLSKLTGLSLQIENDLDERREHESLRAFEDRVRRVASHYIEKLSGGEAFYLCSHLDVLEAAAQLWPTDMTAQTSAQPWSTLEYQVFKLKNEILECGARGRIDPRR